MSQITFRTKEQMNLLGYILRALIERNLKTERGLSTFKNMKGSFLVGASDMQVTLSFTEAHLDIAVGKEKKPDAWVWGSLDTLLGVALGKGMLKGMLVPICLRRLKAGGKIWRLTNLTSLLRA